MDLYFEGGNKFNKVVIYKRACLRGLRLENPIVRKVNVDALQLVSTNMEPYFSTRELKSI